jgi:protein O-GlcNAc transferase
MAAVPDERVGALLAQAVERHREGRLGEAEALYDEVLRSDPRQFDALHLRGVVAHQQGEAEVALVWFGRAAAVRPDSAALNANRGAVLRELGRAADALVCLDRALAAAPRHAGASANRAAVLLDLDRPEDALDAATRALALVPGHSAALFNRAGALAALGRVDAALAACAAARAALPGHVELLRLHGDLWRAAGRPVDALACYDAALAQAPQRAGLQVQRGHVLAEAGRLDAAAAAYADALALAPELPWVPGHWLHVRLKQCDWRAHDAAWKQIADGIAAGAPVCEPYVALLGPLPAALQRRCAQIHVQRHWPAPAAPLAAPEPASRTKRLRIGYFSSDFRDHATAHLLAGAIEAHDRERVEAIAFAFGPPPRGDALRERLRRGFDRFIEVHDRDDAGVARLARELGVDIAVDLNGHTRGARTGVFAQRAAPLQIAWLGYPGTLGAPFIDYLVADPVVLAAGAERDVAEAVIRLPHCYQPNDDRRPVDAATPRRADLGLPDDAFVYCCFNNPAKITPEVFALWMRLLRAQPDAVLWLLDAQPWATQALRAHAAGDGIAPERLVFAPRRPPAEHLARHRAADLALDTWPYGAHTTASDALWAGVPFVTWGGPGWAGRVGASLLCAAGLPELVADSAADCERLARTLAADRSQLARLRGRLAHARSHCALFDTAGFTRRLEAAYAMAWSRRCDGLPPLSFDVPDVSPAR